MNITEYVAAKGMALEVLTETESGVGEDIQYDTTVRLEYAGRTLETSFGFGTPTLQGAPLDERADLVLDGLVGDASTFRRSENFEDFAGEFGINPDSRKELAWYEAMGEMTTRLAEFLGGESELEYVIDNIERL